MKPTLQLTTFPEHRDRAERDRTERDRAERDRAERDRAERCARRALIAPSGIAPSGESARSIAPSGIAPSGIAPSGIAPSGIAPSGIAPSGTPWIATPITSGRCEVRAQSNARSPGNELDLSAPVGDVLSGSFEASPLIGIAPSGELPSAIAPSGIAPSGESDRSEILESDRRSPHRACRVGRQRSAIRTSRKVSVWVGRPASGVLCSSVSQLIGAFSGMCSAARRRARLGAAPAA